jgi:hypothetical protein
VGSPVPTSMNCRMSASAARNRTGPAEEGALSYDGKALFEVGAGLVGVASGYGDHGDSGSDDHIGEFLLYVLTGAVDALAGVLAGDADVRLNGFAELLSDFHDEGLFVDIGEEAGVQAGEVVPHG